MLGSDTYSRESVVDAACFMDDHSRTALTDADTAQVLRFARLANSQADCILELAGKAKATQGSDSRDKIHGLLGLVTDGDLVIPEYNKPAATVYCDFALTLMERTASLDFMNMVDHFCRSSGVSWSPFLDSQLESKRSCSALSKDR